MSEPMTALKGAKFEGFAKVEDMGPVGMITLRGKGAVLDGFAAALGLTLPETGMIVTGEGVSLGWMSPDELLVLCAYDVAPDLAAKLDASLNGQHGLVAVVSDARSAIRVSGATADEVLRKVTPANLDGFAPGTLRRSRFAQVAAAFHSPEPGVFEVVCFRSQGQYVYDLLANAAKSGSELGLAR